MKNTLCTMPPWVEISCKAYLLFNIFSDDPHVGNLILGLYLVFLITGQILEKVQFNRRYVLGCWCMVGGGLTWGVSLTWGK